MNNKPPALSLVHAMLDRIGRERHAKRLNHVVNDPSVLPFVKGDIHPPIDLSPAVANPDNVLLMGQYGGVFYEMLQPGIYEAHTQVLPEGRGEWTALMVRATLHWMFCRTDALEIVTKIPKGNYPARILTKSMGLTHAFTIPEGFHYKGRQVPVDVYAERVQDWFATAPGLEERGRWLADITGGTFANTASGFRYLGMAGEMLLGRQPEKALAFYNRWAALARRPPLALCSVNPLAVEIEGSIVVVRGGGDIYMAVPMSAAAH